MLELIDVNKKFERRTALTDVTLRVPKGATHALIGSSGSGKTTLLRITLGLIPLDTGYVKINEQALSSFSPVQWADRIGYVQQDGGLTLVQRLAVPGPGQRAAQRRGRRGGLGDMSRLLLVGARGGPVDAHGLQPKRDGAGHYARTLPRTPGAPASPAGARAAAAARR